MGKRIPLVAFTFPDVWVGGVCPFPYLWHIRLFLYGEKENIEDEKGEKGEERRKIKRERRKESDLFLIKKELAYKSHTQE